MRLPGPQTVPDCAPGSSAAAGPGAPGWRPGSVGAGLLRGQRGFNNVVSLHDNFVLMPQKPTFSFRALI